MSKGVWGQFLTEKPSLDEIAEYFKGKGGGPEGESHIVDANADKKEGFVWVYSTKADAAKIIDLDQLGLSPQCGFASTVAGNPVTVDDEKAKLARIVEVAEKVWG